MPLAAFQGTAQQGQQELPLRLQLWQTSLGRQRLTRGSLELVGEKM